jgi:hypothetical protein
MARINSILLTKTTDVVVYLTMSLKCIDEMLP